MAQRKPQEQKFEFKGTPEFFKALNSLSDSKRLLADEVFVRFKINPFDPALRPHRIHKLSSRFGGTVWSVTIDGDLRALFMVNGNVIQSIGIGTHDIYK